MKVLVTGASGFVGRTVVIELERTGAHVVCTSRRRAMKAGLETPLRTYHFGDLTRDQDWAPILDGVDAVVHLAGKAHVRSDESAGMAERFREVNVFGTRNLIAQAIISGVKRFVFVSSIGVNGRETSDRPFQETDHPNPTNPYSASKFEAELTLRELCLGSCMDWVILRPPLIYGADAPGNLARLVTAIRRGWPLPLANVDNRRSLLSVQNMADCIVACLQRPQAANQLFVVADDTAISTPTIVRLIAKGLRVTPKLFSAPQSLLSIGSRAIGLSDAWRQLSGSLEASNKKLHQMIGWTPAVDVHDGLPLVAQRLE